MKICVIGPTYPFRGGIAHYTTLLVKNLRKKHDVVFFSFKRQYPQFLFPGRTQIDNSKVIIKVEAKPIFDSMNPYSWLAMFYKVKKLRPELLIFNWVSFFFAIQFAIIAFLTRKFTRTKVLMICHNVKQHEARPGEKVPTKLAFKNADYFIVHSVEDSNNLKQLVPNALVKKTFHPTYNFFKFENIEKSEAQNKLCVSGNVILYFGFVREYKGLMYLIWALPMVLEKVDVHLLVVGEFWEDKRKYLEQIKNLKIGENITIVDRYIPNEEVGLYFSAADTVVLPYISATQSGIAQIAFGLNKPVITTNVGGIPEVVEDGKTGFIVPPQNSKALADAIIHFYENKNEEEFVNNIIKEREKFSWDRMVEVIESFNPNLIQSFKRD